MYCQLCLEVDAAKIFLMDAATLQSYSRFLQVPLQNTAPNICYECSALLQKYQEFKMKCNRAHNLLLYLETQELGLILQDEFEAQRKIYNLESKLSLSTICNIDIDLQEYNSVKVENVNTKFDCQIDNENDEDFKINKIEPHEYIENDTIEYSVNDLTDASIGDLDDKTVPNNQNNNVLSMNATQIANIIKPKKYIDVKWKRKEYTNIPVLSVNKGCVANNENLNELVKMDDDTSECNVNELTDTSIMNFDDLQIPNNKTANDILMKANQIANNLQSKKDIGVKAEENDYADTSVFSINKGTVANNKNLIYKNKLVLRATEIANNIKAKKDIDNKKEKEKKFPSKCVRRRSRRLNTENKRFLNQESLKGFTRVVPLTPEAARNEILLRKKRSNYLNSAYKCELCYRGFLRGITFDYHMKKHSLEFGPVECEYCHYRFPNKQRLSVHNNEFHKSKYICEKCDYVSSIRAQAVSHVRNHKGELLKCNMCDATFRHANTLAGHKRREHARSCACEYCGNAFINKHALQCHKNLRHRQESPVLSGPRCAECALQFATQAAYERHLVMSDKHRDADGSNVCGICGNIFYDKRTLKKHLVNQHTYWEQLKKCAYCGEVLYSRSAYNRHMRSQHPLEVPEMREKRNANTKGDTTAQTKPYLKMEKIICELCGMCVAKNLMAYHMLKHRGERPYKCKECGKGYGSPALLRMHRQSHAARAYQCDACALSFKLKGALVRHIMRSHAGIRPHKCAVCSRSFPYPCELKLHVKYVHDKVPWPTRIRKRKAKQSPQLEEMEN